MHRSSYDKMVNFAGKYLPSDKRLKILDVGSYNQNGDYRNIFPNHDYEGCDIAAGPNVDFVMENPYVIDRESGHYDVIISGQALEHVEYPWVLVKEMAWKLKPGGIMCIIVPGAGPVHRAPLDCWRFNIDGMNALAKWAGLRVFEVYQDENSEWKDTVLIAQKKMAIPKKIFTIWFQDPNKEMPELIKKCIESQKIPGYEHRVIGLEESKEAFAKYRYLRECLDSNLGNMRWCKLSDFLRHYYLLTEGGIYLDSDVEVLPGKNFDAFLNNSLFTGLEGPYFAASVIGSVPGHVWEYQHVNLVESNFRGDGTWVWETGMKFWNEIYHALNQPWWDVATYPEDYFSPYKWRTKELITTPNTVVIHHFAGSWSGK